MADPAHAPYGELVLDEDEQKVCCHECGRWYAKLGSHIVNAHDMTAAEYRLAWLAGTAAATGALAVRR